MGASCELDSLTFSRSVSVGVLNEVKFSFSFKKKKGRRQLSRQYS